ncbi:armadillo-type protein [Blakeslea trispora]|nr:armadillo-type protein [Blakeslea trispora]
MQINDDRLTFLLPRPVWVNDVDVHCCSCCNSAFGPLKRRHHCRNCGNIFCHECSSRNVPLPQLGYGTKAVRVCNGCFDVAYLVTYAIDEDHGLSTQMHGVRGLLELTEKDDARDLHNMVAYGGVDALIWLCRSSKSIRLHHLTTTILAMLAEKESIRPVIITKWALSPLLFLIGYYTQTDPSSKRKSPANSVHSSTTPSLTNQSASSLSSSSGSVCVESRESVLLEIIINCTHIIYQLSRAGMLSQKEVVSDGVFDMLLYLAKFDIHQLQCEKGLMEVGSHQEDEQPMMERVQIIQNLAAKAISAISSSVSFQPTAIGLVQGTDKLSCLLRSQNVEVRKYMAKTMAYLSLRNDKYKPILLNGDGAKALVSVLASLPQQNHDLHKNAEQVNSAAISHACCALANFATNNESQINLMSQAYLLKYICNVSIVFPTHTEIHRHVARCLANLALYEENNKAMLTEIKEEKEGYNTLPTLVRLSKVKGNQVQRHVVRALDNLSSNAQRLNQTEWQTLFHDAFVYLQSLVDHTNDSENDTIERAKHVLARRQHGALDASLSDSGDTQQSPAISGEEEEERTKETEEEEEEDSLKPHQQKQSKKKRKSRKNK